MADNTISPVVPNVSGGRNVSTGQKAVTQTAAQSGIRLSAKVSAGRGDEFGGSYILRIHKCAFKSGAAWHCQLCTVTGEYNS